MAAQHQPAAGAASSERSAVSSLLRELAEVVVLAVILYIGISFAVQAVHVEGLSMFATLDDNDYLIANKIDYRLHAPQRGDIIILRPPTSNSTDFIKRVIALPGEKLLIRSGVVYINGHRLIEPYLPEEWTQENNYPTNGSDGEVIPPNDYFVMGDNRNRSQDSRFFGPISRDRIDGKAWFRIWPLDHFGNIYAQMPTLETGTTSVGTLPGLTRQAAT
jgi:signal peptidase I